MRDRWSMELTDEEWAIIYKALESINDLPYVDSKNIKAVADKIFEEREKLTPRGE